MDATKGETVSLRERVLEAIRVIDDLLSESNPEMEKQTARALLREAIERIDGILKSLEPERFLPNLADASTTSSDKETALVEEIMRLINTIDASSIRDMDERMRVNYVINGMSLFNIKDKKITKMQWCLDMMRRIKVAMTPT